MITREQAIRNGLLAADLGEVLNEIDHHINLDSSRGYAATRIRVSIPSHQISLVKNYYKLVGFDITIDDHPAEEALVKVSWV